MKITIESTTKITNLNGVPARIWEGVSENGVKIHCFITRVAIDKDEPNSEQFEKELKEHKPPTPEIEAIPLRMII
jgi:hypothetical protein